MKDFPLNDLLSATELDRIRQALVSIFIHLRKIRNTKYPIQRALRLVEAISRDLSTQLLKVNIVVVVLKWTFFPVPLFTFIYFSKGYFNWRMSAWL